MSRQQRKEAAEAQRAAERQAAQQKRDEEATEKQQLLVALRAARKTKADELGQVRDPACVGKPTLLRLVELCMQKSWVRLDEAAAGPMAFFCCVSRLLHVVQSSAYLPHCTC